MTLYDINKQIEEAVENGFVDAETGEILDDSALNELQMARDEKIENIAIMIKNYKAEAEAIKAEKMNLAARQQTMENRAEWLKRYLASNLDPGEKVSTPRASISWRKSETVEVEDIWKIPDQYLKRRDPDPDKTAIKAALKAGEQVTGAMLVTKNNLQIK